MDRPTTKPRAAIVVACDWLGELPDQDAGAEPVLRILTDLPAGGDNAFYMDVVDPRPRAGEAIRFGIAAGPFGTHHVVAWNGRLIRRRGYAFDWIGRPVAPSATSFLPKL